MGYARNLALSVAFVVAACGGGDSSEAPSFREGSVRITTTRGIDIDVSTPSPIKLGKNELALRFPNRGAELVTVTALMPAHGHGTHPSAITRTGDGYQVSGLVLYMSGRWELRFALRVDERDDEGIVTVDVP